MLERPSGQQCWALWAFLAACPCMLFIDIICLCLLIGQIKMLACLLVCGLLLVVLNFNAVLLVRMCQMSMAYHRLIKFRVS